jgi:N-glycosylase/DNA lyase
MKPTKILEETVIELLGKISEMNGQNRATRLTEQQLWEELVACILGSRVVFETAYSAFSHLKHLGYLSLRNDSLGTVAWQERVAKELNRPLFLPPKLDGTTRKYPFPHLRSKHIAKSWEMIYREGRRLLDLLAQELESRQKRVNLMRCACGIGPKQASLFLRNSYLAKDVAILDTHVLRYMVINRLAKTSVKTVSSLAVYEQIEDCLRRYADSLRTTLSELDTAIWITMRVFLREARA